ncbi:V/A-type H+-transporting ATPase subunit E [Methanohalophilus levihalophilus]|uniref:V-type ATP synthase subunit E n=1 Tax=Methanohalophilus levihalophilus TaxID=1431282 RepID=UPI001AE49A79|nr:V-type ATP synthase subunit E [Methanohalophilus levihalophilus]MBP2031042.1 V/A-type H+-transporting ATPase subunit E [Methanohalophilus levihalophilus]
MGLETVIKDIIDVAEAKVSETNAGAEAEASEIMEAARQSAKKIMGDRMAQAESDIQRMKKQEVSSANLEVKRTMLNARKDVLERVYEQAVEIISSMPESKQEDLLKAILEANESSGTRIYSNKESEELVKRLSSLEYAGNIDCVGGVIIENEEATVRLDFTYDIILKRVYEQNLRQTSDILFG